MKISVPRKYYEAYQDLEWSDVSDAFFFILKNPELVALSLVVLLFGVTSSILEADPVADDRI